MRSPRLLLTFLLFLVCCATLRAQQEERILSYDSDITVNDDGSMLVTEKIRVHANGDQIKHGIYRDFPTEYKNKLGIRTHVPFEIVRVMREGQPEDYHTSSRSNGIRVYIGPRFSTIPPGDYTYAITYKTDRQLGYYNDRDEIYWNVTGNGWKFPIERATATVHLPFKIPRRVIETYGYTGPKGYQGRDFKASLQIDDSYLFETTKPLAPYEGMTVVCWWDKGYMRPPTEDQKRAWFFEDNRAIVFSIIGLVIVLLYQIVTWAKVGKDPAPGSIVPQYMPPPELSAPAMRELVKMSFDNKAFASCVVSMASKKYLTIEKDALDAYALTASKDPKYKALLSPEERLVADRLFATRDRLILSQSNHLAISEAIKALKKALAAKMERVYFMRNSQYLTPSIILSGLTLLVAIWFSDSEMKPAAIFMLFWLSFWTLGVTVLMLQVINVWKAALRGGSLGVLKFGGAIFLTLFALPFLAGEAFGIFTLASATSVITVFAFGALIASNFIFHELLKAPTRLGRELLDKVDGFKMFLAATDGDQIKRMAPVNWNADTFNRYLPFAIALDVEAEWTAKFNEAVAAASAAATTSSAAYSGALAATAIGSGFTSSLGDSLSSAISSASTAPGSGSGSSGGGSSGGGGGGGGGGGW